MNGHEALIMFLNLSSDSTNRKRELSALFILLTVVGLVSSAESYVDRNALLSAPSAVSLRTSSMVQSALRPHPSRPQNIATKGEEHPNGGAGSETAKDSDSGSSWESLRTSLDDDAEPFPQIGPVPQTGATSQTGTEDWTQDGLQVGGFPMLPDAGAGAEIILYSLQDQYCRGSVSEYCHVANSVSSDPSCEGEERLFIFV